MSESQKFENLLNLALSATEQERQRSEVLETGYDEEEGSWELIVRYHGDAEAIRALPGARVETLLGGYAIVWLPREQIDALAALTEVEYVEKPKQLLYEVENGRAVSCIDSLQPGAALGQMEGLTGRGILVAILDSGIDYSLSDFRNPDGTTRILFLWDQTLEREFTGEEIDAALAAESEEERFRLVPSRDLSGHGTAVAGIAAGAGSPETGRYRGVAPESDLLIVKLGTAGARSFPRTTQLMRGLDYVLRKGIELRRPVAVNISIGNTYGSHDGDSLLETFIDEAAGFSSNCIVIGSGNEGGTAGHYAGTLAAPVPGDEGSQTVEMSVGVYETGLSVQLWKSYADEFAVELIAPSGAVVGPFIPELGTARYHLGGVEILLYYGEPKPYTRSQEIFVDFLPENTYLDSGVWKFRLTPRRIVDGRYNLWLPGASLLNRGTQFLRRSPQVTLTIPSTAIRAITVGAYDSRNDTYADFSGRGFLRSLDLVKPELAAPGVDVITAVPGGGYSARTGTSFAAPFVTGGAALLMEWGIVKGNDPYLYGEKVKAYLIRGARQLGISAQEYPNRRVGYGALCVRSSLPGFAGRGTG